MPFDVASAAREVLDLLDSARDILDERVDGAPPAWCEHRGWTTFLLGLDDGELARCEAEGLAAALARWGAEGSARRGVPPDLAALGAAVREATRLPELAADGLDEGAAIGAPAGGTRGPREHGSPDGAARGIAGGMRAVGARKRPQLEQLAAAASGMAERARRIVDVGSGSGHFTTLAAELFGREVVGIERSEGRIAAAAARAEQRAGRIEAAGGAARFLRVDAGREELHLEAGDLAVGLHACGALGDRLVAAAAATGCDVALVSCCLQKVDTAERAPLSRACERLVLRREVLGLTNLTSQARGVEVTLEATMRARETRFALLQLLRHRGLDVGPGEEMRGINRRRARGGLAELAARALERRGLEPATAGEIDAFEAEGRRGFDAVRRLSLPRNMLARAVEIAVVLDRASALLESGHDVRAGTLFDSSVTPRNIALLASRAGSADRPRARDSGGRARP